MKPPIVHAGVTFPPQLARLADDMCDRFEAALKAGGRPDLVGFLAAAPAELHPRLEVELRALEEAYASQLIITLAVIAGPHQGQSFHFARHDTFTVGRSRRAHFRLSGKDKYFSRFHFLVEVNPPFCRLLDMGSHNGTYLNGQRVKCADLHDGDQVKAGHTLLQVNLHGGPPETEPDRAGAPLPASAWTQSGRPGTAPSRVPVELGLCPRLGLRPGPCQVCTASYSPAGPCPPAAPGGWPLCPACADQARGQPQPIPGYLVIRTLGQGGMGIVSLALRGVDGQVVALKTISPALAGTRTDVERFLREARILADLHHTHIVAFHEMGEIARQLYFVMDYVAGTDAKRLLECEGALPLERALALGCQLLEALEHAHDHGFVHRDIKPANVLVTSASGREIAKLTDFGLARVYQASNLSGLTLHGEVGGTLAYMAPEQITHFREAKPAADQYAAAATLYHLLTGQDIFDLPEHFEEQIVMILENEPVPIRTRRPNLPAGLAAVLQRALAKKPAQRFPGVRALRRELMHFY